MKVGRSRTSSDHDFFTRCPFLCLSRYVCVCVCTSVPAGGVCSLGSLMVFVGCVLLPRCEEQGSDVACPFGSLWTFDTPSAEVSLTYFPLAAPVLSCGAPQQEGRWGRSCLRLDCCPGVLNHCHLFRDTFPCVCVGFLFFFLRCVGGFPHPWTHTATRACAEAGYEVLCGGCR